MKDFKHEGYSVFYQILEILREQEDFKYPLEDCDLLVDDLKTTEIIINSLIFNYSLFQNDGVFFWSNELIESLQPYLKMKQQRIEAAQKSVESRRKKALGLQTTVERPLNETQTTVEQSKLKESKVNETKEKESKKESSFFVLIESKKGKSERIDFDSFKERFKVKEESIILSQRRESKNFNVDAFDKLLNQFFIDKTMIAFESQNHFFSSLSVYIKNNCVNVVNKITVKEQDQFGYA